MLEYPKTENTIVCIVATGYSWEKCVFGNPKKDYWTLNNMYAAGIKTPEVFDEWFQIHRPGSGEGHIDDAPMRKFLTEYQKPVWLQKDWGKEMPVANPHVYPINEVLDQLCPRDTYGEPYPYFTNSVDYMICLAALRGYKEIQLYGVEFISEVDDEYFQMRQSVNYYIAKAECRGIKVLIQPQSSLLKAPYWYGYRSPLKDPITKIRKENLAKIKQEHANRVAQLQEMQNAIKTLEGGIQALEQMDKIEKLRQKGAQI